MQVKIDRETLLKGVGRTLGVVDRRGTMPILSHFLLHAEDTGVKISATDLEVSFRGFYPAEVMEPGALTLPAHYFHNLIKELPGEISGPHRHGKVQPENRSGGLPLPAPGPPGGPVSPDSGNYRREPGDPGNRLAPGDD